MNDTSKKASLSVQLTDAIATLATAQEYLLHMHALTTTALKNETSARNAVNEAQNNFDVAVSKVRSTAPGGTNWQTHTSAVKTVVIMTT